MASIYFKSRIPDVVLVSARIHSDERGDFYESMNLFELRVDLGLQGTFVQENTSVSKKNVIRGLHFQIKHPQGKFVRVVRGAAFDVVVDVRPKSKTFGKHIGFLLSENHEDMLWIPPGCAHGFMALEDNTTFIYKVTDHWHREYERTLKWDDPDLGIKWPLLPGDVPILSDKDQRGIPFNTIKDAQ